MMNLQIFLRRNPGMVLVAVVILLGLLYFTSKSDHSASNIVTVLQDSQRAQQPAREVVVERRLDQTQGKVPKVWTYSSEWNQLTSICGSVDELTRQADFHKLHLRSILGEFSIYTHDPKKDYISSQIKSTRNFEPHIFETIHSFLAKEDSMNLIDVGANIGVISLQAAKLGRRVISLDAAKSNIEHICASAATNQIGSNINLVHNAVSDNHTTISFVMGKDGEFGASFMDDKNLRQDKIKMSGVKFDTQNLVTVETVLLDDLLRLPDIEEFKTVFIKLDVEGSEHKALLGSRKLFQKLNVRGILMEWRWHVKRLETKSVILQFMEEQGFEPYDFKRTKLDGASMTNSDVIWLPKS